jgi:hypothetical protein
MGLSTEQRQFVERRKRLTRLWRPFGVLLSIALSVLLGWMWRYQPLLVNPVAVTRALADGGIDDSLLLLMAGLLPVAVLLSLILTAAVVLFAFVAFANERKLIAIIEAERPAQED